MKLAEALEQRSERGPHRDPDMAIAAARSTQGSSLPLLDLNELATEAQPTTIWVARLEPTRRGTAWLAAAAVIAAAVIAVGGLVILRNSTTRNTPAADAPTVPARCGRAAGQSRTPSTNGASGAIMPPANAVLPLSIPDGYCATSISFSTGSLGPRCTTVWSSCTDCAAPTGSAMMARIGLDPGTTETPERPHEDFTITGRRVRFYPAIGDEPTVQLVSRDGLEPGFSFYGWGVTETDLSELATSLIAGNDIPATDALHVVFDGQLGARWPGAGTVDSAAQINYGGPGGDGQLSYSYQHDPGAVPELTAFASATPNATFTTVNGQPALVSSYQRATTILLRPDDHTLIGIESIRTGQRPPLAVDELSAITLTAATSSDPRWQQLNAQTASNPATGDTVPASGVPVASCCG